MQKQKKRNLQNVTKKDQIEEKEILGQKFNRINQSQMNSKPKCFPSNMLITGFHSRTKFNSMRTCVTQVCACARVNVCVRVCMSTCSIIPMSFNRKQFSRISFNKLIFFIRQTFDRHSLLHLNWWWTTYWNLLLLFFHSLIDDIVCIHHHLAVIFCVLLRYSIAIR